MALEVTHLKRTFTFTKNGKPQELPDPNPEMSAEDVMKFYGHTYPELTNAILEGPTVSDDKANYSFTTKAGKLG